MITATMLGAYLFIVFCLVYVIVMIIAGGFAWTYSEEEEWLKALIAAAICVGMVAYMILWTVVQQDKQNCEVIQREPGYEQQYEYDSC